MFHNIIVKWNFTLQGHPNLFNRAILKMVLLNVIALHYIHRCFSPFFHSQTLFKKNKTIWQHPWLQFTNKQTWRSDQFMKFSIQRLFQCLNKTNWSLTYFNLNGQHIIKKIYKPYMILSNLLCDLKFFLRAQDDSL